MKITEVCPFVVNRGPNPKTSTGFGPNWVFVKIRTDEGIEGVGEAFPTGRALTTEAAIKDFARLIDGKDPGRVLHLWNTLYRGARYPLGPDTGAALSAIEQALWDIAGKRCGLPVYKLLGGPTREKVKLYASGVYLNGAPTPAEGAKIALEKGYRAVKFCPLPHHSAELSFREVEQQTLDRVKSVREAIGDDVEMALDYHGRSLMPAEASELARHLVEYRPMFLEEPGMTDHPDSLLEVKNHTSIPIAAGERCISRDRFRELIEKRAVHILQPDPGVYGGITETMKLAAMGEMFHMTLAPHHAGSPLSLVVCAHIDALVSNFLIQECNVIFDSPLVKALFPEQPRIEDGYLILPESPGLGITFDEEAAKAHPYQPFNRPVGYNADGAVWYY